MPNFRAIHSVSTSLMTHLTRLYEATDLPSEIPCQFRVVSSGELAEPDDFGTALTLYLYRVTMNANLRNARQMSEPVNARPPLSLDLHFLLTAWANNPVAEQTMLGWAMLQIHHNPVLDISSLSPEPVWTTSDVVHLIPAELSNEDIMRIWDALEPSYRLSVSYVARVVRIEAEAEPLHPSVVARRIQIREFDPENETYEVSES